MTVTVIPLGGFSALPCSLSVRTLVQVIIAFTINFFNLYKSPVMSLNPYIIIAGITRLPTICYNKIIIVIEKLDF